MYEKQINNPWYLVVVAFFSIVFIFYGRLYKFLILVSIF